PPRGRPERQVQLARLPRGEELAAYLCPYLRLVVGERNAFGTDTYFAARGPLERNHDEHGAGGLRTQREAAGQHLRGDRAKLLVVDAHVDPDTVIVGVGRMNPHRERIGETGDLAAHRAHRLRRGRSRAGKRHGGEELDRTHSHRTVTVAW